MAYIGAKPVNGFFKKQDLTTDGSTTTFSLDFTVGSTTAIIVSVGGVVQEPDVAYNLSGGGTSIIFTEAPASTADTYIHFLGQAIVQNLTDVNGTELILDADADTSLTADTDDQIDIKVGGTDRSSIKTTGFHNIDSFKFVAGTGDDLQIYHDGTNSFIANSTGALKIATETSGIAVTIGHSTSEVTIADNMTVAGDLTVTGTANFGDTNITNVGSITLDSIINDGSDGVTIDSSTDVIIDAGGADIILKDDGTEFGRFTNNSTDFEIKVSTQDKDIKFIGDDGGSAITALTLDMSAAGDATFNNQVIVGDGKLVLNSTAVTSTAAELNALDGITSTVSELNILDGDTSASSVTIADADQIILNDGGTMKQVAVTALNSYTSASIAADDISTGNAAVNITTSSGNITIDAAANDTDIIFKGTDNTSDITMLTLDGSEAGNATFNGTITSGAVITSGAGLVVADDGNIGSASDTDALAISSGGVVTFSQKPVINSGVAIDNITIDGTEIDLSSGDLTVDVAGDITLDADGADINLADGGTTFGTFTNSSSDFVIDAAVQDKDIIFKGDDGGSAITSLTLDMSNSGAAIFSAAAYNAEATLTDDTTISWNAITQPVAKVTLGGNRTLGAASGGVAGAFISLLIIQDGTGSRTVTFNAAYEFASDTAPTLTTTASKGDLFVFRYNGSKWLEVGRNLALTLS